MHSCTMLYCRGTIRGYQKHVVQGCISGVWRASVTARTFWSAYSSGRVQGFRGFESSSGFRALGSPLQASEILGCRVWRCRLPVLAKTPSMTV